MSLGILLSVLMPIFGKFFKVDTLSNTDFLKRFLYSQIRSCSLTADFRNFSHYEKKARPSGILPTGNFGNLSGKQQPRFPKFALKLTSALCLASAPGYTEISEISG